MEKIKIDKEIIKEFVKKTRSTKQFNKLSLFYAKIDNQKYETCLYFQPSKEKNFKIYYFGAGAGDFYINDEEVPSIWWEEGYHYILFYPRERINLDTLYEICQRLTDEFIDGLNKQQKLIEEAIKNGVKKNDGGYFDTDDFECLANEINNIWGCMGFETLEEGAYSGFEEFKIWLGNILEEASNKKL